MVTISIQNDFQYNVTPNQPLISQQPYKKLTKIDSVNKWTLTETLDNLKEFTFVVSNDEHEKANILLERDISIPFLTPFNGIITEKKPGKSTIEFKAIENAWHLKRKKFNCCDKKRISYTRENWYNKDWKHRRKIKIIGKKFKDISSGKDLINYPLLFHTIDPELKNHALSNGFDILFVKTETNGTTTKLHHEIESYTGSTGELWAWVEFPEIRSGQDNEIHMYFGNEDASDQQNITGTWSDYLGGFNAVWHLHSDSLDSTVNNNDGTDTSITRGTSQIANAAIFDGLNSKIDCGSGSTIDDIFAATGGGWVSCWIRPYSDGEGDLGIIANKVVWSFSVEDELAGFVKLRFKHTFSGNDGDWITTNRVAKIQGLNRVGVYYDNTNVANNPTIFCNGIAYTVGNGLTETTTPTTAADSDASSNLILGNNTGQTATFNGIIDNFKILKNPPSNVSELVKVEYASELDPCAYYIIESVENYIQQADIIAEDILASANRDMPVLNTTPVSNLISVWKLDNDVVDEKGGYNGTWSGTELYTIGPFSIHRDKAAKFNGSSRISTADTPYDFTISNPFTIQVKVKTSTVTESIIFSKRTDSTTANAGYNLKVLTTGIPVFEISNGTTEYSVSGTTPINDNNWHTVLISFSGNSNQDGMKIYHDGNLEGTGTTSAITGTITNNLNLTFGAGSAGALPFTGNLDDIRVYGKEVTTREADRLSKMTQSDLDIIQTKMQWKLGDGHVTEIPNLLNLWRFDQTVTDVKGIGDAVVVGSEQYTDGVYDSKAFDFDGATFLLTTQANVNFERTDSFTFVLWFKHTSASTMMLIRRCNPETTDPTYYISSESGKIHLVLQNTPITNSLKVGTTLAYNDGLWHHLMVSYAGNSAPSGVKIYIDGSLTELTTVYNTLTSNIVGDNVLTIGAVDNGTDFYTGAEDDIRIYNRVLTEIENKRLYEATDSGLDRVRDDDIPMKLLEKEFLHKDHLECLRSVSKELGKNIFFDSGKYTVFIKKKGKEITPVFSQAEFTSPKISLENVSNIVNVVGSVKDGVQLEKTFTNSNTLKYDYEETFTDNHIATETTLDSIGINILDQLQDIQPDLEIKTTPDQLNRFDIQTGDTLNINELKQILQGIFRVIKISSSENNVTISLSRNTNSTIQTSGNNISSILSNIIAQIQDSIIKPE